MLEKDFAKGNEFLSGKLVLEGAGAPCSAEESHLSAVSPERGSCSQRVQVSGTEQADNSYVLCVVKK